MEQKKAVTLFEYTAMVGNALRVKPELQNAWITAELSDLSEKGGHCYVELLQKNEMGQTIARMRATIWSSTHYRLREKFRQATNSDLKSGIKVMVQGSVSHHNLYGLSFNILDIDPSYTLGGDLERIRREILDRLAKEGLADYNKNLPVPMAMQRIAVISAEGAAGYGDFMNQLLNNTDNFVFYPHLFHASMQGEKTVPEVLNALDRIEQTIDLWDCVVIIRGGGSTTDMNAFDNYELAKRVCTFGIPVIVGIGHERDRNVLDELACVRCKTPTAVAGYLIDNLRTAWTVTHNLISQIIREATLRIEGEKRRLGQLEVGIPAAVRQQVEKERIRLDGFARSVPMAAGMLTTRERTRLDNVVNMLKNATGVLLQRNLERLNSMSQLLDVLSPDNTLKRGYSITRIDGKAVRDAAAVPPGSTIETTLHSGTILSTVD